MYQSKRKLSILAVAAVVVVATAGYLAGHGRSAAAPVEQVRSASAANVQLDYPVSWQQTASAPEIPHLSITHPVVFAPHGVAANAGLVIGQLPGGEPSPLPRSFVSSLHWFPDTEEVDLLNTQAYMYSRVIVPGFNRTLTLYVVPDPGGYPTVLACYASAAFAAELRTCGQIASTLTLVGQSQSYSLTPEPAYAREVSSSIQALNAERVGVRREMSQQVAPSTVQRLATRLADGYAKAVASLSALEPSFVVGQAQTTLTGALGQARAAYTGLAVAAGAESSSGYASALTQVSGAEANVNAALEDFALLGYA
jgi:hypothetical protein